MYKADLHHHAHFIQNSASWELADLSLKRSGRVNSLMTKSGHLWEAANESRRNLRDFFKGLLNAKTLDVKKSVSTWGTYKPAYYWDVGGNPPAHMWMCKFHVERTQGRDFTELNLYATLINDVLKIRFCEIFQDFHKIWFISFDLGRSTNVKDFLFPSSWRAQGSRRSH